jgi:hypothetical protein
MMTAVKTNHLIHETSPYLLQHAHNPVDWYPWGEEAFERARRENKPIFLSIGYSACHWCHVMERESFEDEEIARVLNEHFVSIKVDREEHPEVDALYMNAVQLMTGGGGWPLSVFLTPDLKPFFGGTYFPPRDIEGYPGFPRVLEEIARLYDAGHDNVVRSSEKLTQTLRTFSGIEPSGQADFEIPRSLLAVAFRQMSASFDGDYGGFGQAPKFPQPTALAFLLRYYAATGEPHALSVVETTLEHMARGGIFDQLGGGFHRYSTDGRWLVPHFEKMLNDNALLAGVYLDAWRVTGRPLYERIARETLDYVLREMTDREGGFYSARDADSGGVEGDFYVWTAQEIHAAVGERNADVVMRHFGVEPIGNFEGGKSVLSIVATADEVARQVGRDVGDVEAALREARRALFDLRRERVAPAMDDKIVAAWNGLMISSMARAGVALTELRYLEAARRAADFLLTRMRRPDGGLWRSCRQGECRAEGCLPDYAALIGALFDLYEAKFDSARLEQAVALAEAMISRFWDERDGAFFFTENGHASQLVRIKDAYDNPDPSGNAMAVTGLLRLTELTERASWREMARATLRLFVPTMAKAAIGAAHMLSALDFYTAPPRVVVIAGAPSDPAARTLIETARRPFAPNTVIALADATDDETLERLQRAFAVLEGKTTQDGRSRAYVCQGRTCGPAIINPGDLRRQLLPPSTKTGT